MTCTKTGSKNDPFLNCRRKPKELSKKELSNVAPASYQNYYKIFIEIQFEDFAGAQKRPEFFDNKKLYFGC